MPGICFTFYRNFRRGDYQPVWTGVQGSRVTTAPILLHAMAPQATATSRKKEAAPPAFASITASDIIRAPTVQRSVPLDLLPLLKPFKRSGRLALRIERLPQRAKLSAGRRNSDGSWSLASDELEELNYLVPSNVAAAHELTVRIMKFDDGAASTLKVIQYHIAAFEEGGAEPQGEEDAACRSSEAGDPVLRNQLGEMQSLFAVRESELIELRAALEQIKQEKTAELEKARAAWELELDQRLVDVAARVQSDNKKERDARQSEQDTQAVAQTEARAERKLAAERRLWQLETDRRIDEQRKKWLAEADKRVATELERLKSQMERRIDAERQAWRNATEQQQTFEAERQRTQLEQQFETERKAWAAETERRVAAEAGQLKALAEQQLETERQKWRAEADQRLTVELERLKTQMQERADAERQTWRTEAEKHSASEYQNLKAQLDQRVDAERQSWQEAGEQRAAADRDRLNALADQRIVEARRLWQAEAEQSAAAENLRRAGEAEQRLENERRIWRCEAEQRLENERRRCEAENLIALGKAEEQWRSKEAERAAAARNEWQLQSAQLLSQESDKSRRLEATLAAETEKSRKLEAALEALVQAKNGPATGDHAQELDRLRNELAQAKASVAESENELARSRMKAEQERERWRRDAESALEEAARAVKAEEAARLEVALATARAQSEQALAEMAARCEQAEQALAQAKSQPAGDDGYVENLRAEVQELRKALTNQEVELGWARAALDESRPLHVRKMGENLPITNFQGPDEEQEDPQAGQTAKSNMVRDCLLVAGLVIPLIVFYPWIAAYLPAGVQNGIASMTGGLLSTGSDKPAPVAHAALPPPAPKIERPTAFVGKSAKLRETPAARGSLIVTLQKNASVFVLERRGNWTHVEVPAKDETSKPLQGWVLSSALGTMAADKAAPPMEKSGAKTEKAPATVKDAPATATSASATEPSATPAADAVAAPPPSEGAAPAEQSAAPER
jgi:hypothetical protein